MTAAATEVSLAEVLRVGHELYERVEKMARENADKEVGDSTYHSILLQKHREEAIQLVLCERRPMGANPDFVKHAFAKGSYQKSIAVIESIWDIFPEDWIRKSADAEPLKVTSGKVSAGSYWHKQNKLTFGGGVKAVQRQTAGHEMCHRFEHTVPGLTDMEKEFHAYRTADSDAVCHGSYTHKKRANGSFLDKYMGVFYAWGFFEILSCGVEMYVLGRSQHNFKKDPEYAAFVLGVLALV